MAMGKKQDIGDIIRGAIDAMGKPKRRVGPRVPAKQQITVSELRRRRQMPKRKGAKSDEGTQDLRDVPYSMRPRPKRTQPKRRTTPETKMAPSLRQMPKQKPKAAPKRGAKY
jgi:hypothetical protein